MIFGDPYVTISLIRDPLPGVDHSPPWNPSLYQSLEGAYTMWMPSYRSQARKLVWPWLSEAEADSISRAVRSVYAPGPIACYDPAANNLLGPAQAVGRGSTWMFGTDASGGSFSSDAAPSSSEGTINRKVKVSGLSVGTKVFWRNPSWHGFPIYRSTTAGRSFYFQWANGPTLGTGGLIGVDGLNADGTIFETVSASATSNSGTVSGTLSATSIFMRPYIKLGPAVSLAGPADVGIATFRIGTTVASSLSSEGVGCPGYGLQNFSDVYNMWPYRTIQASLVEVVKSFDTYS